MHVVTSKTSHMFVTSAHDQTKISAKHHLPLRQNDFPSQRLPFSPWHHTAPNRWQSPRICHLHAKVAHDILLHRGDIRLRNKILLLCSSLPNRRIHQLFNTGYPTAGLRPSTCTTHATCTRCVSVRAGYPTAGLRPSTCTTHAACTR